MLPPRLETSRLILDAHVKADLPSLAETWADPAVMRYVGGRASSMQDSWFRLLRYRGLWSVLGYGYWCVRTKEGGRYVGDVGFADFKRQTVPALGDAPEAGWVLASWAHNQGFATEALAAALKWLDANSAHACVVCVMDAGNLPSARVATKNGFHHDGSVTMGGETLSMMTRRRPT